MITKEKIQVKEEERILLVNGMLKLAQNMKMNECEFVDCMDALMICDIDLLSRFILVFGVNVIGLHFVSKETKQRMNEFVSRVRSEEPRVLDVVENRLNKIIMELDSYLVLEMLKKDFKKMFENNELLILRGCKND